ncbi:DUF6153 family protein [Streptomyces werraensis]|uniref:DUF6153 family protein n=1 Tax=Streptomyces werraensis TaxID=68284 RepID=UPI0033BB19C3
MLVTLSATLAVLVHHELAASPVAATSAMAAHTMSHSASMSTTHTQASSPGQAIAQAAADIALCPSMAMQLCSTANITAVQLAAPPESPLPAVPAEDAAVAGVVDAAHAVSRAPPDLSVLSQLRI